MRGFRRELERFRWAGVASLLTLLAMLAVSWLIDAGIDAPGVTLQTVANVSTIVSCVVLLVVGVAVYRRFNGNQLVVDRQVEAVFRLLGAIDETRFVVDYGRGTAYVTAAWYQAGMFAPEKSGVNLGEITPCVDGSYIEWRREMKEILSSVFMPRELTSALVQYFTCGWMIGVAQGDGEPAPTVVVGVFGRPSQGVHLSGNSEGRTHRFARVNDEPISITSDLSHLIEGRKRCLAWLATKAPVTFESLNV